MVIVGTSRLTHPTLVLLSTCGPAGCRSDCDAAVGRVLRPFRVPVRGSLIGGAEDVGPERTGLQGGAAAQCPDEGPASLRCVQALRYGVQGGTSAEEPAPGVGDQGPVPG